MLEEITKGAGWLWNGIEAAVAPILVLGVLIVVHEFGHFLVAKLCGVGVLKFSVGFGPSLLRFRRKETEYQLSLIPLGGYVRMLGDMPDSLTGAQETDQAVRDSDQPATTTDSNEDRSRWFIEQSLLARSAIVFAGPLFNLLLTIVLLFISFVSYGDAYLVEEPIIGRVMEKSPAALAGLRDGDQVLSLNQIPMQSWEGLATTIHQSSGTAIELKVKRGDELLSISVIPEKKNVKILDGASQAAYFVGIEASTGHRDVSVIQAGKLALVGTFDLTYLTCELLVRMAMLQISHKELAGPVFIFQEANRKRHEGFENLLRFMSLLSISLAVLNLLPIPVLDGGHLLFFMLEAVFGPISVRKREFAQQVGVVLLLSLMILAIHNDFSRDSNSQGKISWEETPESTKVP